MNLPNKLTISRIIMTVFFLIALFSDFPFCYTLALVLFVIASITDFLDGSLARKHGLITDFGKLMDPLADKILICSAFIGFIQLGWMPAWIVVIIVARELAITGLRLLAASKNQILAAERQGKNKTITQITAIISLLINNSYAEWGFLGKLFSFEIAGNPWSWWAAEISIWAAVVLTAYSGTLYLWKNREVYLQDC